MSGEQCFAVVSLGLEEAALGEAQAMGLLGARASHGGIEFGGGIEAAMRACLWLRLPTTVRLRLGRFVAKDRRALEKGLFGIDWRRHLPVSGPVSISCTSRKSRFHHTGMLAEAVAKASGRELMKGSCGIHLRLDHDQAEVSLDVAGERLHLRGWRQEGGRAPLRETLAAGILSLTGWRPEEPLCDPMCGSGTLPIEAALIARRMPPGLGRRFAFQDMVSFDARLWERMVEEARSGVRDEPQAAIVGSDRHGGAIGSAGRNATRAKVESFVSFARRDVSEAAPPPGAGLGVLVTNPPYGARVGGEPEEVRAAYESLGRALRERFSGWRCYVLSPSRSLIEATGLSADEGAALDNGGIRVRLYRLRAQH